MKGYLILKDGTRFSGELFGSHKPTQGEVVFSTAMVGYEQSLTDQSFSGQILCFTYPMIGNYGVPSEEKDEYGILKFFEGEKISVRGVVVCEYSKGFSHYRGEKKISDWLEEKGISGISGIDTRALTEHLRDNGSQIGQIVLEGEDHIAWDLIKDPNTCNLVDEVSCKKIMYYTPKGATKKIAVFDCGIKYNILREFLKRGVEVHRLPWDFDITGGDVKYDGIFISNGPGNPEVVAPVLKKNIDYALDFKIPFWGICLGNQVLSLAIGGKTKKMRYGNRGANQPCRNIETGVCMITSQNHGYEVDESTLPDGWKVLWKNLNDGSVEGISHNTLPAFSVQFHPEGCPGPEDANVLFDDFLARI